MTKVLVVEDSDDYRELLSLLLNIKGYSVVEAIDGEKAVELATTEKPDLILMDLNLPIMDGWEATRKIHEKLETQGIPVFAMSAQCYGAWRERAFAAGAVECFLKPVDLESVTEMIHKYAG